MKILIADDEKPARGELRYMLEQLASTATFFEARNGNEALEIVAQEPIDVVFLDINMPGVNGLAVASAIMEKPTTDTPPPIIVFATAYDAHAVKAFELSALDYVVKPFHEPRLAQTMIRVRRRLAEREERQSAQVAMQSYVQGQTSGLAKLWGEKENKNCVLLDYSAILWVEAEAKRVFVQSTTGDKLQVRYTLKELEARLAPHGFMRVHKGYVVNLDYIAEVVPWFSGTYIIRMNDEAKSEVPMSRQYGKQLRKLTGG